VTEPTPTEPAAPAPTKPRRLSTRRRLQFIGIVLLAGTLLAEGALRLAGFPRGFVRSTAKLWADAGSKALGPFAPGAEATIAWPPELAYTVRIGPLGLREPSPAPGKPVVLCLGDSTTFGANVEDEHTYPAHLRAALARDGVDAAVVNGGCPRWTITDQLEFLERALPALRPRVVVRLFCGNDLTELDKPPAAERADRPGLASRLAASLALPEAALVGGMRAKRAWLQAKGQWPQPLREDQGRTGDWARPYWKRYSDHLASMAALCRSQKVPLLVAAFPGYLELAGGPCEVETTLPELVTHAGATWVDLYGPFRARGDAGAGGLFLLPHDAHASPLGNQRIADVVSRAVAAAWPK
jgi:lysophospholipase L1-like esterase